ncbi:DUF881 domain-containing protein [Nocardioides sp.]|uniref:DUF881 domain-containing protein n=1 Tax=Nocardioides sp. TaxID=35761 RepID=UPI003517F633
MSEPDEHEHHGQEGHEGPEHRAPEGPGAGRRRQVVVAVLLALLGFAVVAQIQNAGAQSSYAGLREQDLIDILQGLAGTTQRTQDEIEQLTATRDALRSESSRRRAALDQAAQELDDLNVLAGLVPVTGPGIRVTISEPSGGEVSVGSMLDTIQELRSVEAEAIQINGSVRVVASTSIEEGPTGLLVDGLQLSAPYVVEAIGVPSTLAGAMSFPLGPRSQLESDGAVVEVEELQSLDISTVRQPQRSRYAEPAG